MHHPTDRITHTSHRALAGMRISSMGPPWSMDPTTHHTMSERSYHNITVIDSWMHDIIMRYVLMTAAIWCSWVAVFHRMLLEYITLGWQPSYRPEWDVVPWWSVHSWCDGTLDQSFMVDPLIYFLLHPMLHDWCNKGSGMCFHVSGTMHIKEPFLLLRNSSPCGSSCLLFEWCFTICLTLYNCK